MALKGSGRRVDVLRIYGTDVRQRERYFSVYFLCERGPTFNEWVYCYLSNPISHLYWAFGLDNDRCRSWLLEHGRDFEQFLLIML